MPSANYDRKRKERQNSADDHMGGIRKPDHGASLDVTTWGGCVFNEARVGQKFCLYVS